MADSTLVSAIVSALQAAMDTKFGAGSISISDSMKALAAMFDTTITSGSNSNGSFIKFGDGTMICFYKDTVLQQTTVAQGAIYTSDGRVYTFASAFIASPIIIPGVSVSAYQAWPSWSGSTTNTATTIALNSPNVAGTGWVMYVAIGRWKA